jgi:hypothetical protein
LTYETAKLNYTIAKFILMYKLHLYLKNSLKIINCIYIIYTCIVYIIYTYIKVRIFKQIEINFYYACTVVCLGMVPGIPGILIREYVYDTILQY